MARNHLLHRGTVSRTGPPCRQWSTWATSNTSTAGRSTGTTAGRVPSLRRLWLDLTGHGPRPATYRIPLNTGPTGNTIPPNATPVRSTLAKESAAARAVSPLHAGQRERYQRPGSRDRHAHRVNHAATRSSTPAGTTRRCAGSPEHRSDRLPRATCCTDPPAAAPEPVQPLTTMGAEPATPRGHRQPPTECNSDSGDRPPPREHR